jgi:hypothetical protein
MKVKVVYEKRRPDPRFEPDHSNNMLVQEREFLTPEELFVFVAQVQEDGDDFRIERQVKWFGGMEEPKIVDVITIWR